MVRVVWRGQAHAVRPYEVRFHGMVGMGRNGQGGLGGTGARRAPLRGSISRDGRDFWVAVKTLKRLKLKTACSINHRFT
jgi:hypothetical protein